jgi:hypothetical protein
MFFNVHKLCGLADSYGRVSRYSDKSTTNHSYEEYGTPLLNCYKKVRNRIGPTPKSKFKIDREIMNIMKIAEIREKG